MVRNAAVLLVLLGVVVQLCSVVPPAAAAGRLAAGCCSSCRRRCRPWRRRCRPWRRCRCRSWRRRHREGSRPAREPDSRRSKRDHSTPPLSSSPTCSSLVGSSIYLFVSIYSSMYDRCVHMHSMSAYALACARTLPAFAVCACERACNKFGILLDHCLVCNCTCFVGDYIA